MKINKGIKVSTGIKFMAVSAAVTVGASAGFASAAFAADFGSHGFGNHTFSSQSSSGFGSQSSGGFGSQSSGGSSSQSSGSNDEASKPAAQILADAKQATLGAKTVQISGSYDGSGSDLSINVVAGQGQGSGTVTVHSDTFHVVLHGKNVYLDASSATWNNITGDSEIGSVVGNKWLEVSKSGIGSDYAKLVTIPWWVSDVSVDGSLTNAGTTTYEGQSAIDLRADDGDTIYVAAQGPAYILGIVHDGGEGSLNFSKYNTVRVAHAPRNAENLNNVGGGF